jgi:hypothetical protein
LHADFLGSKFAARAKLLTGGPARIAARKPIAPVFGGLAPDQQAGTGISRRTRFRGEFLAQLVQQSFCVRRKGVSHANSIRYSQLVSAENEWSSWSSIIGLAASFEDDGVEPQREPGGRILARYSGDDRARPDLSSDHYLKQTLAEMHAAA